MFFFPSQLVTRIFWASFVENHINETIIKPMGIMKPIKIMSPPVSSSASQATAEQGLEEMLDKVKKLEVPSAEVATGLGSQWAL